MMIWCTGCHPKAFAAPRERPTIPEMIAATRLGSSTVERMGHCHQQPVRGDCYGVTYTGAALDEIIKQPVEVRDTCAEGVWAERAWAERACSERAWAERAWAERPGPSVPGPSVPGPSVSVLILRCAPFRGGPLR